MSALHLAFAKYLSAFKNFALHSASPRDFRPSSLFGLLCLSISSSPLLIICYHFTQRYPRPHWAQTNPRQFWAEARLLKHAARGRSPQRLKGHDSYGRTKYNGCCKGGRIRLPFPREPPPLIKKLFEDRHFMENVRAYNQMFAMTSFGAKLDTSINSGRHPYVFKVEGQISHWMGSLCPPYDHNCRFLQMYVYDTANEVSNRLRHFHKGEHTNLKPEIVEALIHFFDESNDLVKLFHTAYDKNHQNFTLGYTAVAINYVLTLQLLVHLGKLFMILNQKITYLKELISCILRIWHYSFHCYLYMETFSTSRSLQLICTITLRREVVSTIFG
ncbi:hypothetical protein OSB04_003212 [Centaurea solstitialis]|uniref:Helitron helicase-like domain-containing protein n=1 Tax=Centaurea solstitialis TaxID=347529 RepID=A0AA38WVL9_9ASTR|nr:hypothetical protein OSB04_003212 [Centaurea solstitialis]